MKSDAQFKFEKNLCELLFPDKKVVSLSIDLSANPHLSPEIQATFILDEPIYDTVVGELKKYHLELTPKDEDESF